MLWEEPEDKRTFTFVWRVENLSHCLITKGQSLDSPVFEVDARNISCCLCLFPRGIAESNEDVLLKLVGSTCLYSTISYELSFLDADGFPLSIQKASSANSRLIGMPAIQNNPTQEEVFVTKRSLYLPEDTLTVQCCLWKSDGDFEKTAQCFARTVINYERISFLWTINKFSTLQSGQRLTIPIESPSPSKETKVLNLNITLVGPLVEEASVDFQIYCDYRSFITCKISILDSCSDKTVKQIQDKHLFESKNSGQAWNLPKFVMRRELVERKGECLPKDVLSLRCDCTVSEGVVYEKIEVTYYGTSPLLWEETLENIFKPFEVRRQESYKAATYRERDESRTMQQKNLRSVNQDDLTNDLDLCTNKMPFNMLENFPTSQCACKTTQAAIYQEKDDSVCILQKNLLTLYQDHTLSDLNLRSGDVSFLVHKNILSARSPVFKALLSIDTGKPAINSLNVPDVDAPTLNRMLTFLYTGAGEDLQWEIAAKLYYAADKYEILSLKQKCSRFLIADLSVSNVCGALALANRHQDDSMRSAIHDFILGRFDEIMHSDEWENFLNSDVQLAGKTMYLVYKRKAKLELK